MRNNKFSRGYFLTLILLASTAGGDRLAFAQSKGPKCSDGPGAGSIFGTAPQPVRSSVFQPPPTPPARPLAVTALPDYSSYNNSSYSTGLPLGSSGIRSTTLLGATNITLAPANVRDKRTRRDPSLVIDVDTSGGNLYRLWDVNGTELYAGSSIGNLSQTLNREIMGQNRSIVDVEVNGLLAERNALITSLSIQQQQIHSGMFVTRGVSEAPLEPERKTGILSFLSRSEITLKAFPTMIRSNVSRYRERRSTNRIIKRSIKRLRHTHPATKKSRIRKEVGRTRLVSIPKAQRAAELWMAA